MMYNLKEFSQEKYDRAMEIYIKNMYEGTKKFSKEIVNSEKEIDNKE